MHILGINITTLSKQEILEKISERIITREKTVVFTPNPEMIESVSKDILNSADFNLPDGIGLKIACFFRFLLPTSYSLLPFNTIHGIDFMLDLCAEAEKNNWTIGLLGGMNGVASKTEKTLTAKFPKLQIAYVYGDFVYSPDELDLYGLPADNYGYKKDTVIRKNLYPVKSEGRNGALEIRENPSADKQTIPKPTTLLDILFVALGTPKEQLWITENRDKFPATIFMEVGGSFDILSGRLHRAPKIIQAFGLEWLFRLIQEPRRLPRQLQLIKFLWRVLTTKNSVET